MYKLLLIWRYLLTRRIALLSIFGVMLGVAIMTIVNAVMLGFESVMVDTGFKGRWQVVSTHPLTICETAHNPAGVASMLHTLATMEYEQLHIIFGCVNDKDCDAVLSLLPKTAKFYFTGADFKSQKTRTYKQRNWCNKTF